MILFLTPHITTKKLLHFDSPQRPREAARPTHLTTKLCYVFNPYYTCLSLPNYPESLIFLAYKCLTHEILQDFWSWLWTGQLGKGRPTAIGMAEYLCTKQVISIQKLEPLLFTNWTTFVELCTGTFLAVIRSIKDIKLIFVMMSAYLQNKMLNASEKKCREIHQFTRGINSLITCRTLKDKLKSIH